MNNKRLMVKSFTDYVKMYFKDDPTREVIFEKITDKTGKRRWEVAITSKPLKTMKFLRNEKNLTRFMNRQ